MTLTPSYPRPDRPLRIAIVGAGPAGVYTADILTKEHESATVDIFDRLPAPYGLVRYGVAPDHPRIKEIVKALQVPLVDPTDVGATVLSATLLSHPVQTLDSLRAARHGALDSDGTALTRFTSTGPTAIRMSIRSRTGPDSRVR